MVKARSSWLKRGELSANLRTAISPSLWRSSKVIETVRMSKGMWGARTIIPRCQREASKGGEVTGCAKRSDKTAAVTAFVGSTKPVRWKGNDWGEWQPNRWKRRRCFGFRLHFRRRVKTSQLTLCTPAIRVHHFTHSPRIYILKWLNSFESEPLASSFFKARQLQILRITNKHQMKHKDYCKK